jgi:chromosomal replication initiator protein
VDNGVRNSLASDVERAWERVLERVAERVNADDLAQLIRPLRPLGVTPAEFRLEAPNRLTLVCITDNYLPVLHECVAAVLGPRQVLIDLPVRNQGELFADPSRRRAGRRARPPHFALNPKYTFANFVIGASNQFAHAASKAVATQPGDHYNPLFIYGGVGLGKTHLVNAIGHQILERNSLARIAYLSSEAFMNELISSLRRDRMGQFKDRFRKVDVLILDDVQLLAGRERTQEEFFHTFNTLYTTGARSSSRRTRSRRTSPSSRSACGTLQWGLIADIQSPDVETRVAIIEKKAEMEGIPLSGEVALFLGSELARTCARWKARSRGSGRTPRSRGGRSRRLRARGPAGRPEAARAGGVARRHHGRGVQPLLAAAGRSPLKRRSRNVAVRVSSRCTSAGDFSTSRSPPSETCSHATTRP